MSIHNSTVQKTHDQFREINGETFVATTAPVYKMMVDNTTTANVTYVGKALVGADTSDELWQIKKVDTTSGVAVTFAGNGAFTQIWDDRVSLSYS